MGHGQQPSFHDFKFGDWHNPARAQLAGRLPTHLSPFEPRGSGDGRADEKAHARWSRRVRGVPGGAGSTRHPASAFGCLTLLGEPV
eukprot:145155-Rhodomonas_salina.1